jgi:hypothetical protein
MFYNIVDAPLIILLSFPSFSEFHRVFPLLEKFSTYEFVYDHVFWFCVCLTFGSIFHVWEKTWVRRNFSIVLICISFIAREVEHFFMYLLAIFTSSFDYSLFNSCAHFFIGMLIL